MDYEDNQKLVIFDDYVCDKNQSQLIDYFIQGRHKNCSVVYLSAPGVGFNLTSSGDYDMINKKLRNVGAASANTDAATKKYVDDNSSRSLSTSQLTVDSNIDMKDTYRITNLISPLDSKDPATKYYVDNTFLDRDGSYPMKGNLNMDNNRIFNLPAPNGSNQPTPLAFTDLKYLHVNGTNKMTNNLNMDNKKIINLRPPTSDTDATNKKYVDDSIPNTSSFIKKDGSVVMTGNLNLGNKKIVGLATPTSNTDAATKKYVDDNAGSPDLSDYLEKDGSVTMTGNLNLGNNKIVNLNDPTTDQEAANRGWVRKQIERFDHHSGDASSSVFTITDPEAPTTLYLQFVSGSSFDDFVFTTSAPGQPLVGWKPSANTYINKIEFQFGSRNINVDFLWFIPRDSSKSNSNFWYNVDINANFHLIKNINFDRNNDLSAAPVLLVKELAPFTKNALYRLYFFSVYDFADADSYGINIGSSGVIINSVNTYITLPPNKDLSNIKKDGLHVNGYDVTFSPTRHFSKTTLCIVFTHWRNRSFTLTKYLPTNNNILFDGKIIVVWLAEDLSANVTKVSISNYSATLTIPAVNYIANQHWKFTTEDGVLLKLMYSPKFYDTDSEQYHKVMLQEKLNGSYIM
ncbi:unnamed protein product [Porites evermanni]|uniref:Uncharacterized protein n=1 Tax=Porites evermanni TaxID=104178 RepID=A0ABN8RIK3_9CNID|nr:unnamed protein product [Porites evermanni]